jgi:uncharacterized repeat protein (TIGR03803 family)
MSANAIVHPGRDRRRVCWALLAAISMLWPAIPRVRGAGVTLLYSFSAAGYSSSTGAPPEINNDGFAPASRLVQGTNGDFYGTTLHGGLYGAGTIFAYSGPETNGFPIGADSLLQITDSNGIAQYNFKPNDLAVGTNGDLYGTTQSGGTNFNGTVFMVTPTGAMTTLHTFGALDTNSQNSDGANPTGALAPGTDGNFYGVTQYGGSNGNGTIFQLTAAGAFTNLYSFSALNEESNNADGATPNALAPGSGGAFYGTTQQGGANGAGTVFEFTAAGGLTTLHSFQGGGGGEPSLPGSALVPGPNGNFYGTSAYGGSNSSGTVFEVSPDGAVKVLYSFPQSDDGAGTTLTLGSDGNFYGTTAGDGANGTGTLYKMSLEGAYTKLYSFPALNTNLENSVGANPTAALALGMDGELYGSCQEGGVNGSGTLFRFSSSAFLPTDLPPSIVKEAPAKVSAVDGSAVSLSVTAKGAATLAYQWMKDGTNLSDAGDISDSSTSTLRINPVQAGDAGTYSVVVTNGYGKKSSSNTQLTVTPDLKKPGVAISSPKENSRGTAPVLKGTATDNARVTNVVYWLTNLFTGSEITGTAALSNGTGGASNWFIAAAALPGTNILSVQSVGFSSRTSKVVSVTFFREARSALGVEIVGGGAARTKGAASVSGDAVPTNGATLNVGESYSITALPDSDSLFSNWVGGGVVSNSPTLKFLMTSNLVLTANVVSNFFLASVGTYNGLFYPTNADSPVAEENSGMLKNLVLKNTGACSGALLFDGKSYPVTAHFDVSGHAAFKAGELRVDLTLDSATPRITGTVSNTQWTASLTADLASKNLPSAESTILFSLSADVTPNSPPGDGYALVTNHSGMVTLGGGLADGTSYSQAVPASRSGDVPVYASLYGNTGLLLGWVNLTNWDAAPPTNDLPTNQLVWIKKASRSAARYPGGFTNILSLQGAPWTDLGANTAAISMTDGQLVISNAGAGLYLDFTNVLVGANNKLTNEGALPANSLTGVIAPKTGQWTLTFGGGNKTTTKAYGAVLQNQTHGISGGGYFLTTTNAGSVSLQSPGPEATTP